MGTITRSFANNITTSGVLLPASLTNNSIANVTAYNASVATGGMKLISSQTASNSASISFTTGISSTYKEYQFYFININPPTDAGIEFQFNLSTDGGSNYNVTKTSTAFGANNAENDAYNHLLYYTGLDLAQSTSDQIIAYNIGNDSDEGMSGSMSLFNPASTTYVKHFICTTNTVSSDGSPECEVVHTAGYANTTSAINAITFKMSSGNIDDGTILMYGIV
jgi:hypothetical protein